MQPKTVLVTGGAGYLGSVLVRTLHRHGYEVTVLDNSLTSSMTDHDGRAKHVPGDVRDIGEWKGLLRGMDAVVHLAAIVGDPACDVDHDQAWETNYLATVRLAESCRAQGVGTFLLASTCSNYGFSVEELAHTLSPLRPRSVYAETKVYAEHHILSAGGSAPRPTILRLATLHGLSDRMRFDLAVNVMTATAVRQRRITVHGGAQWRPFLHVRDAASLFLRALRRAGSAPCIVNGSSNRENYRMMDIGTLIAREVPDAELVVQANQDGRDYRVDFSSCHEELGFEPEWRILDGVREMVEALRDGRFPDHTDPSYSNYEMVHRSLAGTCVDSAI